MSATHTESYHSPPASSTPLIKIIRAQIHVTAALPKGKNRRDVSGRAAVTQAKLKNFKFILSACALVIVSVAGRLAINLL